MACRVQVQDSAEPWNGFRPIGRVGIPTDIANPIIFVLSDEAS